MRPEWLRCETCLFFQHRNVDGDEILFRVTGNRHDNEVPDACLLRPKATATSGHRFCGSWTCARCLQPWRYAQVTYETPERVLGWEFYGIIDHTVCLDKGG